MSRRSTKMPLFKWTTEFQMQNIQPLSITFILYTFDEFYCTSFIQFCSYQHAMCHIIAKMSYFVYLNKANADKI